MDKFIPLGYVKIVKPPSGWVYCKNPLADEFIVKIIKLDASIIKDQVDEFLILSSNRTKFCHD